MAVPIAVPNIVSARARSLGEAGARWLTELPQIVAALELRWSVVAGAVLTGGSESLVLEAVRTDGSSAIIKIGLPGSADLSKEATVYRLTEGSGFARFYEHDEAHNALLLERLGKPLGSLELSIEAQIGQICQALAEVWIPLDSACGLMTGAEPTPIWQWGFVERVSTGLVLIDSGEVDEGVAYLEVADQLCD